MLLVTFLVSSCLTSAPRDANAARKRLQGKRAQKQIEDGSLGGTALLRISEMSDIDRVNYFISQGNQQAVLSAIAQRFNFDQLSSLGDAPALVAVAHGYNHILEQILEHGANPNIAGKWGQTPLLWVAGNGRNFDALDLLLRFKADPNICDDKGYTPLMMAIGIKNQKMAARLIEADGAQYHIRSENGKTARDYARENGLTEISRLLPPNETNTQPKQLVSRAPLKEIGLFPTQATDTFIAELKSQGGKSF